MSGKPLIVRLLTLGDSGAGKSSLLLRYTQNEFAGEYMPTIGIDFRLKTIDLNGRVVKVQVWDTAGQERFRTITHNYYRGAHGIALVYDCTHESTFSNIKKWIQDIHTYAESNVNIVLIGHHTIKPPTQRLDRKQVVETARGQQVADEHHISFFETSAKADINVQEAFSDLVKKVCERMFEDQGTSRRDTLTTKAPVQVTGGGGGSSKKCC